MANRGESDAWARLAELNSRGFDRRRDLRKAAARGFAGEWNPRSGPDWQVLFQNAPTMLLLGDKQGRLLDTNNAGLEVLGRSRDVLRTLSVVDVVAARQEWTIAEFERFLRNGTWKGELELRRGDGEIVEAQAVAREAGSEPGGFIAVIYERARHNADKGPANDAYARAIDQVAEAGQPLSAIAGLVTPSAGDRLVIEAAPLERRLNQLLEATSLRSADVKLSPTSVDLADVLALAVAEAQARTSDHRIGLFTPRGALVGYWDVSRLKRLASLLLFESILASPPGSSIRIMATELRHEVLVSLTADRGGLQPSILGRALSPSHERDAPDASLSLMICRRIIELHGGRIWFESSVTQGSTLHFTLQRESGLIAKGA